MSSRIITSIGLIAGAILAAYITLEHYLLPILPDFGFTWLLTVIIVTVVVYLSRGLWWGKFPLKATSSNIWLTILVVATIIFMWQTWHLVPAFKIGITKAWDFCYNQKALGLGIVFVVLTYYLLRYGKAFPKLNVLTGQITGILGGACLIIWLLGLADSATKSSWQTLATSHIWYILGAILVLILLFTRSGRKSLPWLMGLAMILIVADCSNRSVQATVVRGNEEWKEKRDKSLLVTTPQTPAMVEEGPKLTLPKKPERLNKPVQVSSEEWRKVPRPDDRYYQFRWCETPRTDILLCVVSNRPPTDTDKEEVFEIGPTEDLSKLPQGPTLWVKSFRTPEGDPTEWTVGFYYTRQ